MKKTNICVMQKADVEAVDMYLYDDISKYGDFDWFTWDTTESVTSADYFKKQLEQIPEDAPINLYINSDGGDVYEATAIYSQLKRHKGKVTAIVDGRAHSAAFTVLQAADHRVMNMGTSAIIHNMWTGVYGNAAELRKVADDLDAMMNSCIQLYMERATGITEEELRVLLDAETVLTPEKALEYGFIDEIAERPDKDEEEEEEKDPDNGDERDREIEELKNEISNLKQEIEIRFRQSLKEEIKPKEEKKGFAAFFD